MASSPIIEMETSLGSITLELDADKAPVTVANFLGYVADNHYDNTVFHRVIKGFMIQGGGFEPGMKQKATKAAIKNESSNGLANKRGTIAMARTNVPDSATSQFFINTVDNAFLDKANAQDRVGYCVFGKVTKGLDVVDKIEASRTGTKAGHGDVPVHDILIVSMRQAKS